MRDTQNITRMAQNQFSASGRCSDTPFSHSGHLDNLFRALERNEMPNFLDMMSAISEISVEMTNDFGPCIDCQRG